MRVAVTGSQGYIGSVLTKMLAEQGHTVYACDVKDHELPKHCIRSYRGSFDEDNFVYTVLQSCDVVFHLAADSLLGPSAYNPLQYYWNNTSRTINFLHKLKERHWQGHVVFSSTAAVYGAQFEPVTEQSPTNPCNHYGKSKLMCEQALQTVHKYGIRTTMFRYFNVAGAYDDVGQDSGEPHLLTRVCNAAAGIQPLVVYGNDYNTKDGYCVRDFVHVRDICQAQIHAAETFNSEQNIPRVYNLGTHDGISVKEIINRFQQVTGINIDYTVGDRREGDPDYLVADPSAFMVDTGFNYSYSNTDTIIESAWDYFKRKHNGI